MPVSDDSMRFVPSIDEMVRSETGMSLIDSVGREAALRMMRVAVDEFRSDPDGVATKEEAIEHIEAALKAQSKDLSRRKLKKVINATGVIIHTNLGRSPLSVDAVTAIQAASGYCNVEMDLETGERGRRGSAAKRLLAELTGAEDALIVNNCAAAALLVLSTVAKGGEVIVSRGELVEIGGDFRVPDVLVESGCRLKEVGTTNRTKLSDYERSITEDTKAILRVHPSNYRITGFTESPSLADLAKLAHRHDFPLIEDAGSGALIDLSRFGLSDEPVIGESINAGADLVVFSGDKLFGSIQAGLIVGKSELIQRCRKSALYRALRPSKLNYAAIEATLGSFARDAAFDEVPMLKMLTLNYDEIDRRARKFIERAVKAGVDQITFETIRGSSAIGGGAGTGVDLETSLIAISHSSFSPDAIAARFREAATPVIARISEDRVLIDLRTVHEPEEDLLVEALAHI